MLVRHLKEYTLSSQGNLTEELDNYLYKVLKG